MNSARYLMLCLLCHSVLGSPAWAEITLLGEVQVAGESLDRSGLSGTFEDGVPCNRFGGISAIDRLEKDEYILLSDRGPKDGAVPFATRFHIATIQMPADGSRPTMTLTATHLLTKRGGQPLIGAANALLRGKDHPGRFDPEGCRLVRRSGGETLLAISDEYGPRVDLFDMTGKRTRKLEIPSHFQIAAPSGDALAEARDNTRGRQPNDGLEGLAISPDGQTLYAILQKPLLQDGVMENDKLIGHLNRILRINLTKGETAEFVYPLDSLGVGVSEILCVDSHRALVLERDSGSGEKAKHKRILLIDFDSATDVSDIQSLPAQVGNLPSEIRPVTQRPFLDLLDPRFGIVGDQAPAKFEGLAYGPEMADGRMTLLVAVDNDFVGENPTRIFVFAIGADEFAP